MEQQTRSPIGAAGTTILVVDDERSARRLLYRMLTDQGYRVFEASNADEAMVVLAQAHRYVSVVLLDVVMPVVDGVELARRMLARWPSLRLVFMSAYSRELLGPRRPNEAALLFLQKPFTNDALLQILERAMSAEPTRPRPRPRPRPSPPAPY